MENGPLLELRNISKSFGAVRAVQHVDLELYHGEILGLVGDNAAGKSTLMKILSGALIPDEGEIYFEGKRVRFSSPHEARDIGIEMVYQDLALCGNLDMRDNVFLGRWPARPILGGLLHMVEDKKMEQQTLELIGRLNIKVNSPKTLVEALSGGQRQAVAIARVVAFSAKVMILDEPTASISMQAIAQLLELMRELKQHGVSQIIISHRLEDILKVADRVMVLRLGRRVEVKRVADTHLDEVIQLMVRGKPELVTD
jgi:ABC-type sugar transport system ATPase subunit